MCESLMTESAGPPFLLGLLRSCLPTRDGSVVPVLHGGRDERRVPGACLLDVGDTLDVMTSDRAYRHTLTYSAGREGIQWQSGRQFDPAAAMAFPLIPEAAWDNTGKNVTSENMSTTSVKSGVIGGSPKD